MKLTHELKLIAIEQHLYLKGPVGAPWNPMPGDHYTIRRADLEVFLIASLDEHGTALVHNRTTDPEMRSAPMAIPGFGRDPFHGERVPVPGYIVDQALVQSAAPLREAPVSEVPKELL